MNTGDKFHIHANKLNHLTNEQESEQKKVYFDLDVDS